MKDELLRSVRAALVFEPGRYLPLGLDGEGIGWVRRDRAASLRAWPDVFRFTDDKEIQIRPAGEPALSAAFAQIAQVLASEGMVRGWRGETYAVRATLDADPLFHLERAAMRFFGLTSSGAHLNGYVLQEGNWLLWIARRAETKAIDPGMLDTLVGGGVPSGEDAWRTLLRECAEEAGIPAALAQNARPAGMLRVCREVPEGLHSEVLHVHDLALPRGFAPRNADGEVSEFMSLVPAQVLEHVARGEMTVEAGLVAVDFLLRHALLREPGAGLTGAVAACRRAPGS